MAAGGSGVPMKSPRPERVPRAARKGAITLPAVNINGIEFSPKVGPDTEVGQIAGAYFILGARLSLTFRPMEQHMKGGIVSRRIKAPARGRR